MPSALSIIGALTLVSIGAAGSYTWDRHPPIGWHAHILFWRPGFDLPDSLATSRDKAVTLSSYALAAQTRCQAAINGQNAEIDKAAALDAASLARSEADLKSTRSEVAALRRASASLKDYHPQGADVCSRWTDADRMVKIMLGTP